MSTRKRMRMFANPHAKSNGFRLNEIFKSKISIFYLLIGSCLFITMIMLPNYAFKQIQENQNIRSEAFKKAHTLRSAREGSGFFLKPQNTVETSVTGTEAKDNQAEKTSYTMTENENIVSNTQMSTTQDSQSLGGEDKNTVVLGKSDDTFGSIDNNATEKGSTGADTEGNFSQAVVKIVQADNSSPSMPNNGQITEQTENEATGNIDDIPKDGERLENRGFESKEWNSNIDYNQDNEGKGIEAPTNESTENNEGKGIEAPTNESPENIQERITKYLNFSERTALNFMHFHKTGGVSFKTALFKFFQKKVKNTGELVKVRDACYKREIQATEGAPGFVNWRCDWNPIRELPEEQRGKYDVIFGHQYRESGAETLLKSRDLRTFAIMRHPFDRKVSFFYHFFIRERGRNETNVAFQEVRDFLLFNKIADTEAELGQEVGPNYMAGRLLSDGKFGYVGNSYHKYFDVAPEEKIGVANRALDIIRKYVFVGLQSESVASMCMLRKTIENFNIAHGISNEGTEKVATTARTLNTGSYSLNAEKIWNQFTMDDKILFDRNEKVDLAIYAEGEKLFKEQAHLFGCGDSIRQDNLRK